MSDVLMTLLSHIPTNNYVLLPVVMKNYKGLTYETLYRDRVAKLENFKLINLTMQQVWDVVSFARNYTFEGHKAPMYYVCPRYKENIQV